MKPGLSKLPALRVRVTALWRCTFSPRTQKALPLPWRIIPWIRGEFFVVNNPMTDPAGAGRKMLTIIGGFC